jgi:conjugal transfer pilus assembly protein TraF
MVRYLLMLLVLWQFPLSASWLERKAEGWAWYEEEKQKKKEEIAPEEAQQLSALAQLEVIKKELDTLLAEALLQPTQENIIKYMETQKEWVGRSAEFSTRWGKVLLTRPDLDPTATTFATTHYGRQLQKAMAREEKVNLIKNVAQSYGLFFFYEGKGKSSQVFSQVVKAFADKYSWTIVGISVDEVSLPNFPSEADASLAATLGITIFPALLAFEIESKTIVPLATGLKSLDQIENNVFLQFKQAKE